MDPAEILERRAEIAADARRRADRLFAHEIILVASAILDPALRPRLEQARADRPVYFNAIRAVWNDEDIQPFAADLEPVEATIIIRAAELLGDPLRVASLLRAPFEGWLGSSHPARRVPAQEVMNEALARLPNEKRAVVHAGLDLIGLQAADLRRRLDELAEAIHRVALAGGEDDTGLFETLQDLDEPGAAAVRRLWDGERDEAALLAATGDNVTFQELIRGTLARLRG